MGSRYQGCGLLDSVAAQAQDSGQTSEGSRRRSPSSALVGGVVIAASLALFLLLSRINDPVQRQVLMLARDVAPGTVLTEGDLKEATIRGSTSFSTVAVADRAQILGLASRAILFKDTLLAKESLTERERLPAGQAIVSVVLKGGRSPSARSGDTVLVVAPAGATGTAVDAGKPFQQRAVVRSVRDGPGSGETTAYLLVGSESAAVNLSVAATTAGVSLILVP